MTAAARLGVPSGVDLARGGREAIPGCDLARVGREARATGREAIPGR